MQMSTTFNWSASISAVLICLGATVSIGTTPRGAEGYERPNGLRSIPLQIVSGIPIWVASDAPDDSTPEDSEGKDQLVQALDAAIARVIDSGQWRQIVSNDPDVAHLVVNMADCYPRIEEDGDIIYPFPPTPVGLLKEILDTREIIVGDYDVNDPFVPGTFHAFDNVNPALLRAIIDELGQGYGLDPATDPIAITPNYLWPPSSALMFQRLALGRDWCNPNDPTQCGHDINGFNAALGATVSVGGVEKRRRDVARFTCTVFGTNWYAHVRNDSSYTKVDDLIADTDARLCVGQLSSRLSEDYFKNVRDGRCKAEGTACTVHADCATGEICENGSGAPGAGTCYSNTVSGTRCTADADCASGEQCLPWITKVMLEDDLEECSGGVSDGTYDIYLHFDPEPKPLDFPCVAEETYGRHAQETELLRRFRDEVLSKTPAGQEIIDLYYQWSPTIVRAMRRDKNVKAQVQAAVEGILPLISAKAH